MACANKSEYDQICRLCTSSLGQGPYHIFDDDFSDQLLRKIEDCLPIKVSEEDDLPKSVCGECYLKLDDFYNFRESCRKTAKLFAKTEVPALLLKVPEVQEKRFGNKSAIERSIQGECRDEKDGQLVICEPEESQHANGDTIADTASDEDDEESLHERSKKLPELGEPCSEDYVLMKEETFDLDVKDTKAGGSNVLADYLVEFNHNSHDREHDNERERERELMKDKDIFETQKLRKEVLPPMWDVYEKTVSNKENDGKLYDGVIKITHRRYIVSKGAFPCSLCGECFEFDQGRGRDDSEEKARLFDCHVCGKLFPRRSSWKRHLSTHEDMKPYLCRICGHGFNRREHLSRHLLSHTNTKPFNCTACGKLFTRKEHLARHHLCSPTCVSADMKEQLRPFCCEVCGHGFVRKEHLLRHRKKNHDLDPPETAEPKPFACDVCHKNFTRKEHLRRHQIIHTRELLLNSSPFDLSLMASEKPFNSEVSMFSVDRSRNNSLEPAEALLEGQESEKAMDLSKEEESDCEEDEDTFIPPAPQVSLEIKEASTPVVPPMPSILSIPSPSRPRLKAKTLCDICNKNFSRRSHLLRHLKRIHHVSLPTRMRRKREPQPGDENGNSLPSEDSTPQNCEICGRTFARRHLLERHREVMHPSEAARYECVTCGQKFVESHLLDAHMAIHGNTICDNFLWMM
ncbi:unnamed protein product [Bemisia tabaci]|uniref:Uncharacterized protein n=1 Tax=Bemisia tabaci TaxID=7038 RepID=A0A9P0A8A2_BEMTA|nr:unnamed protein product [Bemisia tabaci]